MENKFKFVNTGPIKQNQDRPDYRVPGSGLKITPEEREIKIKSTMRLEKLSYEEAAKFVDEQLKLAPGRQRENAA